MIRVSVASCLVCCHELSIDELLDVALGTNCAKDFVIDVYMHSKNVDVPPTTKLNVSKCHASLLSSFLLENF